MWNKRISTKAKNVTNTVLFSTFCWCGTLQSLVCLWLLPQTVSTWQQRKEKCCLMSVRFRKTMLWCRVPQLYQHVSHKCMTAHSYQISSIRMGSWENVPRGFRTAAQEHNLPARWTTNYTLIWETLKRSVTIFFQLNQSLTVISPPPTIEDSHFILLVSCSNSYKNTKKYTLNWIFEKLKYELLRASHNLTAQTLTVLWHLCHKSTGWRNDDIVTAFPCEKRAENSFQSSKLLGTIWLNPSNMPWRIWVS